MKKKKSLKWKSKRWSEFVSEYQGSVNYTEFFQNPKKYRLLLNFSKFHDLIRNQQLQ